MTASLTDEGEALYKMAGEGYVSYVGNVTELLNAEHFEGIYLNSDLGFLAKSIFLINLF